MAEAPLLHQQYEALRAWVLGRAGAPPPGLGLLLRRGMAAWMTAMPTPSTPAMAPAAAGEPSRLRLDSLVQIVATIIWEVYR
jgi:hypothetical protein